MSRVVVFCGGRAHPPFTDQQCAWLDGLHTREPFVEVITGGATGADEAGRQWAVTRGIECVTFWANWTRHGTQAGPWRNRRMLLYAMGQAAALGRGRSVLIRAFPGGKGTRDMVQQARREHVPVLTWDAVAGGTALEEENV